MKKIALGLMSGTSLDGLSLALASFEDKKRDFELIFYQTVPYPENIFKSLSRGLNLTLSEISRLHFQIGKFYAEATQSFIRKSKVPLKDIAVIGSHGQTIFHEPRGSTPNTFQIGEPSFLAYVTGIPVVNDFRPMHIAVGGEGAPLIPYFDQYFWGNGPVMAFQNIGGIGNVTVVGKELKTPIAFDTGPGNCLIDETVQKITCNKQMFDRDGNLAAQGKIWMDCVKEMFNHPYFKCAPPKSTGRELFNESFIPPKYRRRIKSSPNDFLATLTYFTAYTIAQSYKKFVLPKCPIKKVILSGGGEKNHTLIIFLKELLHPIPVCSIEDFGIPAQSKEPLAFAFFALRALEGKKNHEGLILGKIIPGCCSSSFRRKPESRRRIN